MTNQHNFTRWKAKAIFVWLTVMVVIAMLTVGSSGEKHRYESAMLSVHVISALTFIFFSVGLYKGVKLKNDMGNFCDKEAPNVSSTTSILRDTGEYSENGNVLMGCLTWIFAAIIYSILVWLLRAVIWAFILLLVAILYNIFFRAVRLVFKKSKVCKGNFAKSMYYALLYALLYMCWIYGIVIIMY